MTLNQHYELNCDTQRLHLNVIMLSPIAMLRSYTVSVTMSVARQSVVLLSVAAPFVVAEDNIGVARVRSSLKLFCLLFFLNYPGQSCKSFTPVIYEYM
jgi:hypothetical protein